MKQLLFLTLLAFTTFSFSQIVDQFNYTGALNLSGWVTHSGTAGQLVAVTTPSDAGNSLSYAGLPASVGNRTTIVSGNGEDVNHALTGISGVGYYSCLLKVTNTTGLTAVGANGDHFMGFATTSGATASSFGGRLFIKAGATAGTFLLGTLNYNGGTTVTTYNATEYPINTTLLIVIKLDASVTPSVCSLFVNPTPGAIEPAATITNNSGTSTYPAFASLYLRQGTSTGNIQIDEIRSGSTWAAVTPSGCATASSLTVTNCGTYTLNSTPYATSGTYTQTLTNANSVGCDSTITLNLTVNNPTSSTITTTACSSYTLNSTTYNATGTYIQTLTNGNSVGCDSTITLNLTIVGSITYYADVDMDGFGDPLVTQVGCSQPLGYVTNNSDCDDNDFNIGVGITYFADTDSDGFGDANNSIVACNQPIGYVVNSTDCDDINNLIGAPLSYYPDADGDGFGSAAAAAVIACTAPANHVTNNTDCNDANGNQYPGATEIPNNGIDEDCNGSDLNTLGTQLAQYTFTGNTCATPVHSVTVQPANATFSDYSASDSVNCAAGTDYFNYSGWNTGATVDLSEYYEFTITPDNCFGLSLTQLTFLHRTSGSGGTPTIHVRSSLDSYATDVFTTQLAAPGVNYTENAPLPVEFASIQGPVTFRFFVTGIGASGATYRNDNVSVYGSIDALTPQTYYADADGDGFGDAAADSIACATPVGYVTDNTDCNDADANQNPNAVWYQDNDSDGIGNSAITLTQCTQPVGYVSSGGDCNDADSLIFAGITYYQDLDTDGYGNSDSMMVACTQPVGYVTNALDCNDADILITVATDQFYIDQDGDGFGSDAVIVTACTQPVGYVTNNTDCDDSTSAITIGTLFFADNDGDGFGNPNISTTACTAPVGYVANELDCNDTNAGINPNAVDIAGNTIDENCDGVDGYLGINENENNGVAIFPNPGTTAVTIALNGSWKENIIVTIRSVDGKVVQTIQSELVNANTTIATNDLQPSVYFIQLTDGTTTATMRWVKQ